jgi:small subunit ribosomal protein S8
MTISDPIADMLTRIRNAVMAKHDFVLIPSSRAKLSLVKILRAENFITDYEVIRDKSSRMIKVFLKSINDKPVITGLERVSKPGLRVYVQRDEIPRVFGGLGIAIISTSKGIMTGKQAWRQGIGGELLCYIW